MFVGFVSDPSAEAVVMKTNGFQFRMVPSDKHRSVYLGYTQLEAVAGSRAVSRRTDRGYTIEASLPWRNFHYTPRKDGLVPLEFHVLDADEAAGSVKSSMLWNVFEGKQKPWSTKGTRHWGLAELR